jgi:hypothetical protein
MTTTTNPFPDVPLPAGTSSGGWAEWDNECRVIWGAERQAGDARVLTSAVQLPDGSLEAKDQLQPGPAVNVETGSYSFITSTEARELAAAILEAAAEIDGWSGDDSKRQQRPGPLHVDDRTDHQLRSARRPDHRGTDLANQSAHPGPLQVPHQHGAPNVEARAARAAGCAKQNSEPRCLAC